MHVPATDKDHPVDQADAGSWLEALAAGRFTQDQFVDHVLAREAEDPEVTWEVLALLDQYFRRKRIDRETFVCLKARLQRHSLGIQEGPEARAARAQAPVPAAPAANGPAHAGPAGAGAAGEADIAFDLDETLDADDAEPLPQPVAAADFAAVAAPPILTAAPQAFDVPSMHPDAHDLPSHAGLLDAAFHREIRPGDMLCGRYRVVEILQRRDWMTVAEAIDEPKAGLPGIRQRVALQVLDESLSQDALLLQRIGKLQALSHPAITRVVDVAEDNGALVLVSEFFNGVTLRELLARRGERRMPQESALGMVAALARALAFAHARGVAHGDVVAGNVLITDLGDLRLQGFELRAQGLNVQPAADRLAFARLAYELLGGSADTGARPLAASLRAPPGLTRTQWRALRHTLSGAEGNQDAGLLAAFGGETATQVEPVLLPEAAAAPGGPSRRGIGRELLAAAVVGAIIAAGVYIYLTAIPARQDVQQAATAPAPAGQPAAAPVTVTADEQAVATVSAGDAAAAPPPATPPAAATQTVVPVAPAVPSPTPVPAAPPARASSVDLASTYAWVDTSEPVARLWVTRSGNLNREVTFRWWTEGGTAVVDRDFRAIEPRVGVIPPGARGVELLVPLMPDPARREPRTFYVKIDTPGPGAQLGTRTLMQVAIVPPGYPAARDTRAAQNVTAPEVPQAR